jgi:hypothetical protein
VGVDRVDVEFGVAIVGVVTVAALAVGRPGFEAFGVSSDIDRGPGFWGIVAGSVVTALGALVLSRRAKSL